MFLVLLLIGVYLVIWFAKDKQDAKKRPPGPQRFPIIGSMIQLATTHPVGFIALDKLGKKYGDVVSVRLGKVDYAFLTSYDSVRALYSGEDCVDRPCSGIWLDRNFGKYHMGILFNNGHQWAEIRKFISQNARANGFMNRNWLRQTLHDEVMNCVQAIDDELKSTPDQVMKFTPTGILKASFTNLICATLSGKRHKYDDKDLHDLIVALDKFFRGSTLGLSLIIAFPLMRFIIGKYLGYNQQLDAVAGIHKYSKNLIREGKLSGKYKEGEATNFIEGFLQNMDETGNEPNSIFTEEQFLVTVTDLFTAGGETTANWLLFAVLLLMSHPDKQEKLHREIKNVVGDRLVEIEDKNSLIYTQAVMLEVHRWAKITINLGPREAVRDFEYNGRTITKGTTVLANTYSVFNDRAFWGDPDVFRPERFIDSKGQLTNTERIIPFGLGKRVCLGEMLAKESGFIFLVTLTQKYQFQLPQEYNGKSPSLKLIEGITTCPVDFKAKVVKRA